MLVLIDFGKIIYNTLRKCGLLQTHLHTLQVSIVFNVFTTIHKMHLNLKL
jgi:hypothetical protein